MILLVFNQQHLYFCLFTGMNLGSGVGFMNLGSMNLGLGDD